MEKFLRTSTMHFRGSFTQMEGVVVADLTFLNRRDIFKN